MARLHHITFTGIDARTDIQELRDIQREYPLAEFGVLTSYHWYDNGQRYLNPQFLCNFYGQGLNLALHVCGSAAHDAITGDWQRIDEHTVQCLRLFRRVQLNVAGRPDNPTRLASVPAEHVEVIIQQRTTDTALYERSLLQVDGPVSVLLDNSGGQGVYSGVEVQPDIIGKVGYAGGLSADNVAATLTHLMRNPAVGDFWIDMESGVRTGDWFDTAKVRRVLELCQPIIDEHETKQED